MRFVVMAGVWFKSAAMGKSILLIAAFLFGLVPALPGYADFVGHGAPVRDVVISPDGNYAATAGFDDIAILWSVPDSRQIARFYGHEAGVNAVAFLPAATGATHPRIVSVSDDGTARIWDGDTGVQLHRLDGHDKKVVSVAVSGPRGGIECHRRRIGHI